MKNDARFCFRLSNELYEKIKEEAAKKELTKSRLIIKVLQKWLDEMNNLKSD